MDFDAGGVTEGLEAPVAPPAVVSAGDIGVVGVASVSVDFLVEDELEEVVDEAPPPVEQETAGGRSVTPAVLQRLLANLTASSCSAWVQVDTRQHAMPSRKLPFVQMHL